MFGVTDLDVRTALISCSMLSTPVFRAVTPFVAPLKNQFSHSAGSTSLGMNPAAYFASFGCDFCPAFANSG